MRNSNNGAQTRKVDMSELLTRIDGDRELLRDLLAIFREDFPTRLQALRQAIELSDLNQTKMVSHTLKGMLSNLAVTRAAALAGQLEQLAGNKEASSLAMALAEFEAEVEGLISEMDSYTERVSP